MSGVYPSIQVGKLLFDPSADPITAKAGGGQATATLLTSFYSRVATVASAGDSVLLPPAVPGSILTVNNAGANLLDVFPSPGDAINSLAANIAQRVLAGSAATFYCSVIGKWQSTLLVVPPARLTTDSATTGNKTMAVGDITGAEFVTLRATGLTGAGAWTTRTAAQLFGDVGNVQPGDSYILAIRNENGGAFVLTLTGGTNVTITGTATVAANTVSLFNVTFTDSTHVAIQTIATGLAI